MAVVSRTFETEEVTHGCAAHEDELGDALNVFGLMLRVQRCGPFDETHFAYEEDIEALDMWT